MKKVQKTIASCRLIRSLLVLLVAVLLGAGCAVAPPQSSLLLRPEGATAAPTLAEINTTLSAVALQQPSGTQWTWNCRCRCASVSTATRSRTWPGL